MTAIRCHYTLKWVFHLLVWGFLGKIQMFGKTLFKNQFKDEICN